MKLKVLKSFRDKNTGERYATGSIIDPADKRALEMLNAPGQLAVKVEDKAAVDEAKEAKTTAKGKKKK